MKFLPLTGEVTRGNYIIHPDSANTLKGIYYENVTNSEVEVKNSLRVLVELNSPTSGLQADHFLMQQVVLYSSPAESYGFIFDPA